MELVSYAFCLLLFIYKARRSFNIVMSVYPSVYSLYMYVCMFSVITMNHVMNSHDT
jgi:hypothetical protein